MKKIWIIILMVLVINGIANAQTGYYIVEDAIQGKSRIAARVTWGKREKNQWIKRDVDLIPQGIKVTNTTEGPFNIPVETTTYLTFSDMINAVVKTKIQVVDHIFNKFCEEIKDD